MLQQRNPMRLAPAFLLAALATPALAGDLNDYPTSARADYVFACMKANGETRQALEQCSCSIDVIASILPYDSYVAAETVASITQQAGQIGNMYRNTAIARRANRAAPRPGRGAGAVFLEAWRFLITRERPLVATVHGSRGDTAPRP